MARVLVIDDHADAAHAVAILLRCLGHEVRETYSGGEGIALARSFRPEVVLLDLLLGDGHGFEFGHELKKILPGARLIALSGWYLKPEEVPPCFATYLLKPCAPEALLVAIGPTLDGPDTALSQPVVALSQTFEAGLSERWP